MIFSNHTQEEEACSLEYASFFIEASVPQMKLIRSDKNC